MLTKLVERTGNFSHPERTLYLCSGCEKKRRPEFVLRRRGLCQTCYRVRREQALRQPVLAPEYRLLVSELNHLALFAAVGLSLLVLLAAIGAIVPVWVQYILAIPLMGVPAVLFFYGMGIGSNAIVRLEVQRKPCCIDVDCDHLPKKIGDLPGRKSLWRCEEGHLFYVGRFGVCSRRAKWAW